jgi:hypothetical protein
VGSPGVSETKNGNGKINLSESSLKEASIDGIRNDTSGIERIQL